MEQTRLLLLPTSLPTHGALFAYSKRITTTPLCLLVSLMGEAGEHHSPSHQPCPSVNAFERLCVLHYIPLPTNLHLFPEDKCFVKA